MKYQNTGSGDTIAIDLSGSLTFEDHQSFRVLIDEIENSPQKNVVFNLRALQAIDSAGVGLLLLAKEKATSSGKALKLRNLSGSVEKVAQLFKLHQLLTIE